MTRRSLHGWIGTLAVVSLCAGIAIWQLTAGKKTISTWADALQAGRDAYSRISVQRIDALASVDDVRAVLEAMPVRDETQGLRRARDELLDEAAQFIYYRFCQSSPENYVGWRISKGYRYKSKEKLIRPGLIDGDYTLYFGEPFPENTAIGELFPKYWTVGLAYGDGTNKPIALAKEEKGLAGAIGIMRASNQRERPRLVGDLPESLWTGQAGMTMRCWWDTPKPLEALFAASPDLVCAELGMILEYGDGARRPLRLTYVHDAMAKSWYLQYVVMYNFNQKVATYSSLEY